MEKLVSIITPCYNSQDFLLETYQSIINQTYQDWEWIVVDDNSSDNSRKILREFKDNRIKIFFNKENKGAAFSRNRALKEASGRYITFIDSDDIWEAIFLEESINYLSTNSEELVYSSYKRVDENLNKILDDFIAIDKVDFKRILFNCPIPMLTSVYDSSRIGKVFFPDVELREDHAMWIELLRKIKYARAINKPLGIYRIRQNSVSRDKFLIGIAQYKLYKKYLKLNTIISCYYSFCWAINGLRKYGKL